MKIFLLDDLYNQFGEFDWAQVYETENNINETFERVDWARHSGLINLDNPIPISVSAEMPLPDLCLLNQQLVVFNYQSARIKSLFANSKVEWLPCNVSCSYDEDTIEEISIIEEHKELQIALVNPLVRCSLAPDAMISKVGDGYWNQLEAIDNMSLYEDDLEQSDIL